MQIKIPHRVARWADDFGDFLNVVLYRRGQLVVRIVDVLVGTLGTVSTVWWYLESGWWGALQGVLMFILAMMAAFWFF
jgi:uncharacterized membrane protein YccF (DUF307 family)